MDADEVAVLVVFESEPAVVGVMEGLADPPRQVNIGRRDEDRVAGGLDPHDPVERTLLVLERLVVARKREKLVLVRAREGAFERELACRIFVLDAMAGLASHRCRLRRPHLPCPAPLVKDGTARRADARLRELLQHLVGIADVGILGAAVGAALVPGRAFGDMLLHGWSSGWSSGW